jgi:hypothetical protein
VPKFVQRKFSERFLEVVDELIKQNVVANMRDFCQKMHYLPQNMSQVKSGKRDVTTDLIIKLFSEFRGNPIYVLLGIGKKILDENEIPDFKKNSLSLDKSVDSKLISRLEELVESKNEYITMLKKEIERLSIELKTSNTR